MTQVVGATGERGGTLLPAERRGSILAPDLPDGALRQRTVVVAAAEETTIGSCAELVHVAAEQLDQPRVAGHRPHLLLGAVLELAGLTSVSVGYWRVGPRRTEGG
ncbi:hypothetical protein GCM10023317_32240 [Actinopolymorpha pittospori]